MLLLEILTQQQFWYVPNSTREQFDELMFDVEERAKEFEDVNEFKQVFPQAVELGLIFTNPTQDYRGLNQIGFARHGKHIDYSKAAEFKIWQVQTSKTTYFFIEDLLNDPNMVIQISQLRLRRITKLMLACNGLATVQRYIQTDM